MKDITRGHSMTYNSFGTDFSVIVKVTSYPKGGRAIILTDAEDGSPFATATVRIDGLAENDVAIKNYSENAGMLEFLIENNIVEPPHREVESGFVTLPICRLK